MRSFMTCTLHLDQVKKKNEMGIACSTHGEKMKAYRILVGKPERKRSLGGHRLEYTSNIKMDIRKKKMWSFGLD
jgi:hypothetical protein